MFKWLGKIRLWRGETTGSTDSTGAADPTGPLVTEFGQYSHKPVIARAISVVTGVSQAEVCAWVTDPHIPLLLNGELLQGASWARRRLESGDYEIKITSQDGSKDKVWRFFIA
jgi:hypothetical protein